MAARWGHALLESQRLLLDFVVTTVVFVSTASLLRVTLTFPDIARWYPSFVLTGVVILSLMRLGVFSARLSGRLGGPEKELSSVAKFDFAVSKAGIDVEGFRWVAGICLYMTASWLLGFPIASMIWVLLTLRLVGGLSWVHAAAVGAGVLGAMLLLGERFLRLPQPLLFDLFG